MPDKYTNPRHRVIPVSSSTEARDYMERFLHGPTEETSLLKASRDVVTTKIRQNLERASKLCSWEYDPDHKILEVKVIVSSLHAAFNGSFACTVTEALFTIFTKD